MKRKRYIRGHERENLRRRVAKLLKDHGRGRVRAEVNRQTKSQNEAPIDCCAKVDAKATQLSRGKGPKGFVSRACRSLKGPDPKKVEAYRNKYYAAKKLFETLPPSVQRVWRKRRDQELKALGL